MTPHLDHSDRSCPFGDDLNRYWSKRYEIFTKWGEGIRVDREGLYTAKPEAIAMEIARSMQGKSVIDGLCGVGAMSIALARMGREVTSVDHDLARLHMARHNASVYGVADCIRFVHSDVFEFLQTAKADSVFLDPDWGGPSYREATGIGLHDLHPDGGQLLSAALRTAGLVMMCLPINFIFDQVRAFPGALVQGPKLWSLWGRAICATIVSQRP